MSADLPEWIPTALSAARFRPYLVAAGSDVQQAIRLYKWNVAVSEAFYTPLHYLEVAVRNSMHHRLTERFGRDDWWNVVPLNDIGRRIVTETIAKVRRRVGPKYDAGDVVAELSFGFWASLVSRGASYDRRLWVPALHKAFPNYRGPRQQLHDNLLSCVLLRNRIMHHEPVYHRHLTADHAKLHRLLGYVSPAVVRLVKEVDKVPEVLRRKPGPGR